MFLQVFLCQVLQVPGAQKEKVGINNGNIKNEQNIKYVQVKTPFPDVGDVVVQNCCYKLTLEIEYQVISSDSIQYSFVRIQSTNNLQQSH